MYKVMEMELSLMYDILYTKAAVVHTWIGYCIRALSPIAIATSFSAVLFQRQRGQGWPEWSRHRRYLCPVRWRLLDGNNVPPQRSGVKLNSFLLVRQEVELASTYRSMRWKKALAPTGGPGCSQARRSLDGRPSRWIKKLVGHHRIVQFALLPYHTAEPNQQATR